MGRARDTLHGVMQVFIVDDSALVRQRLAELLVAVEHVHVIGEAGTVADALSRIPELRPDLVTVDIRMPDGDGVSVLKAIKQLDRPPLVGVLTMFPTEPSRRRSEERRVGREWRCL